MFLNIYVFDNISFSNNEIEIHDSSRKSFNSVKNINHLNEKSLFFRSLLNQFRYINTLVSSLNDKKNHNIHIYIKKSIDFFV